MQYKTRPIPYLRWWIGGLLFLITVINYIDRQTLNALAPILTKEFNWSNAEFGTILIAFRISYTIMQTVFGRILDWVGTRRSMGFSVAFYSVVAAFTATANSLFGFQAFRFLLAAGESANNPGGSKAVAEWFPAKERAWAVALFDSGSSIGGAMAGFIVLGVYRFFGSWRPAFLVTASFGFVWLALWLLLYREPEKHPRLAPEELEYIRKGRPRLAEGETPQPTPGILAILRYRQTWGLVLGRFLLDPYWFFMAEWFGLYLKSKGFSLEQSVLGFWAPFLGADIGNFIGGGLSSWFIHRGWPVGRARRTVLAIFGPSMLLLMPAAFNNNYWALLGLFAYASLAYAACSTMFLTLPTDVFRSNAVGTVMGLGGSGAGIGVLLSTSLIGPIADKMSFQPVIIVASIIPCVATLVFISLVRAPKAPDPSGILQDF